MNKLIALVASVLLLCGCVYSQQGTRFDLANADKLEPGVSTEADAIKLLGEPVARKKAETGDNEKLMWYYVYGTALATGGGAKLVILFDGNGQMIKIIERTKV